MSFNYLPKQDNNMLKEEAIYLYQRIFNTPPHSTVIKQYIRSNHVLLTKENKTALKEVITKKSDIEAIEIAWRFRNPNNILTKMYNTLPIVPNSDNITITITIKTIPHSSKYTTLSLLLSSSFFCTFAFSPTLSPTFLI